MNPFFQLIIASGFLFFIIFFTGIKLKKTGYPYNFLMTTIHKFASLAVIAILVLAFIKQKKELFEVDYAFSLIILSGILFVLALISGGLLSAGKTQNKIVTVTHKVTPVLILISSSLAVYYIYKIIT